MRRNLVKSIALGAVLGFAGCGMEPESVDKAEKDNPNANFNDGDLIL